MESELPFQKSNLAHLQNVRTRQNNLSAGPKATLYPQKLCAKITRK